MCDDTETGITLTYDDPGDSPPQLHTLTVLFSLDDTAIGRTWVLGDEPLVLGRNLPPPNLGLNDPFLSRSHAVVAPDEARGGYGVVDQRSRNGTFLDGRRIGADSLSRPLAIVRVGETVLAYRRRVGGPFGGTPPKDCLLKGASPPLIATLADVARVAPKRWTVLVLGESGTGKELVAREIHRQSGRSGAFVPVNCAGMQPSIAESELFGHARGAFTGAAGDKRGLIAEARGGTLFLDEAGELEPTLQAKLLRVLEDRLVRPVGATRGEYVDVRFVLATNRDLGAAVRDGAVRNDFFGRLGHEVRLAPLRERPEDLLPIVCHLLLRYGEGRHFQPTADFVEALALHSWPRNVRELDTLLQRAVLQLPQGGKLTREYAAFPPPAPETGPESLETPLSTPRSATAGPVALPPPNTVPNEAELRALFDHYGGNVSAIARHTGRQRAQVYRWLHRFKLLPPAPKGTR